MQVFSTARAYPIVLVAGALLSFAFPEPSIVPLAWVCLVPLLLALHGVSIRRGAGLATVFGIGYFGFLVHWVSIIGYLGWVVLVLVQSVYLALFGASWAWMSRRASGWMRVVLPALLWVLFAEYLRSIFPVNGFTWGQLAQSHGGVPYLLKTAGVAGGWGLAFLIVVLNAAVAEGIRSFMTERRVARGAIAGVVVVGLFPLVVPTPVATGDEITVAVVQGNVPRDMAVSFEKDLTILGSHVHLTDELPDEVDLVLWPESSVAEDPFRIPEFSEAIRDAARGVGKPMIVGGNIDRDDGRYQVMAFLVSPEGDITDQYQKTHLVPFGEYVPARDLLDWIPALAQVPRDAVPGDEDVVFTVDGNKIAPVISFEGDFGGLVQDRIHAGGRLLYVATNTSTWEDSWASAQHVAMSRLRAAENGVYVLHGAISGISAVIEPDGTIVEQSDLWTPAVLIQTVRFAERVTLYARFGDWFPLAAGLVAVAAFLFLRRREAATVA